MDRNLSFNRLCGCDCVLKGKWCFVNTKRFLLSLQSELTRVQYCSTLKLYETFINENGLEYNAVDSVVDYIVFLKKAGLSLSTIKSRLACIKSFFIYSGFIATNFPVLHGDESVPTEGLSNEEALKILSVIPKEELMHKALITTMLFTGIRRHEAVEIKLGMITEYEGFKILTVFGKRNKLRQIPLQQEVWESIKSLGITNKDAYVFTVDGKNPIHTNTVRNVLLKYVKLAGITKKISPHSLRVTCVSNAIENGAPLTHVKQMGGWSSLDMVLRYDRSHKILKNSAALKINYKK